MDAYLLGIDLGTSGAKLCLISEDGSSFYGCTESYELVSERPGYAEEDPEAWWQAVCRGVRTLLARSGIDSRMVRSVGFSGQMHGLVLVDGQGAPVRPAIVHCDARASSYREIATREELLDWGILNLAFSGFQLTTLAWLADHEPQSLEHARHILSPKDYVRYRLTGELGTEWTDAAATLLFDVVHRCWSAQMIERLGIDPALLADVNAPYDRAGSVSAQASAACGLAEGTAVAFGGADQPMQALGNGVTGPGEVTCTVGSGGQLFAGCAHPLVNPRLTTHTFCGVRPCDWYVLGAMLTAGTAFDYMVRLLYPAEGYDVLNAEVEAIMGEPSHAVFLPYLNGERSPHMDEGLRGALTGFSLSDTRAHLLRAVMEGICFAMKDIWGEVAGLGITAQRMIASGGFTRSRVWMKMMASILELPLYVPEHLGYQAGVGAAMIGGVGAGVYASLEEAASALVPPAHLAAEPDAGLQEMYRGQYGRFKDALCAARA